MKWLSAKTSKDYRLPSEAEWEFACRAGTTTPFWWGLSITPEQANYNGSANPYKGGGRKGEYRQKTQPVKSFEPNPWGLYQVHGNVWEWCENHLGAIEIVLPTLGESVSEASVGKWFRKVGDTVKADEAVVEVETHKVTLEVNTPAAGVILEIAAKEGETVTPGATLGFVVDIRHIWRGGSWTDAPRALRAAARIQNRPANRQRTVGFRVVRAITH